MTALKESIHSFVSTGSISSLLLTILTSFISLVCLICFDSTTLVSTLISDFVAISASSINFSVEGGIFSLKVLVIFYSSSLLSEDSVKIKSPFETLSPILTFMFSTIPS